MTAFLQADLPALLAAILVAVPAAVLGSFLLLRREALFADAAGHAVLPGLVLAFALSGTASAPVMLTGALVSALAAGLLVRFLESVGRVERGAALGAVFTSFFALAILLLETTGAAATNFDIHTVFFGNVESLIWLDAESWRDLLSSQALAGLPGPLVQIAGAAFCALLLVALGWKELVLASFDPVFARACSLPERAIGLGLVLAAAGVAVFAFQALGLVPTLALFVCPAAAARMTTDRLAAQVARAVAFGASAAVLGYLAAAHGPQLLVGSERSLNAAGTIAVAAGLLQVAAMLFGSRRSRLARA